MILLTKRKFLNNELLSFDGKLRKKKCQLVSVESVILELKKTHSKVEWVGGQKVEKIKMIGLFATLKHVFEYDFVSNLQLCSN